MKSSFRCSLEQHSPPALRADLSRSHPFSRSPLLRALTTTHCCTASRQRTRQWKLHCHATASTQTPPKAPPKAEKVPTDGTVAIPVTRSTVVLRSICNRRLRYEVEFGLKRGTTDNSYLIQDGSQAVLVDVPDEAFTGDFVDSLQRFISLQDIQQVVLTHLTPRRAPSILALLGQRLDHGVTAKLTVTASNPAIKLLKDSLGRAEEGQKLSDSVNLVVAKQGSTVEVSRSVKLQLIPVPTPRWPDLLCVYHPSDRLLLTSKLFAAHVSPETVNASGEAATDVGGWETYGIDWRHYYDCMLAPVARQAAGVLDRLTGIISPTGGASSMLEGLVSTLQRTVQSTQAALEASQAATFGRQSISGQGNLTTRPLAVSYLAPLHGPVVEASIQELLRSYQQWTADQIKTASAGHVAVLYASAYGNTAGMAQAISRGITKAGVGVETVNLELDSTDQVMEVVKASKGFVIGSPTLGGHMPTQVQTALGALLREPAIRELPCGVFGSFGWSGEAVDEMERRLKDAGFSFAFQPLRVKFKPTARDVQLCEESGTDLAQKALRRARAAEKQASSSTQATPGTNAVQQAVGRIVGALCVVTGKDEDAESAMLASWISQASFDPPGLSISVKKDRAVEPLLVLGNNFIVNVLAQGNEKAAVKQMLKPFKPAEPRFEGLDVEKDEQTGCIILKDASAYVACTVKDRMDAGDHYVVYATVEGGKVLSDGVTSVHHRKSGSNY